VQDASYPLRDKPVDTFAGMIDQWLGPSADLARVRFHRHTDYRKIAAALMADLVTGLSPGGEFIKATHAQLTFIARTHPGKPLQQLMVRMYAGVVMAGRDGKAVAELVQPTASQHLPSGQRHAGKHASGIHIDDIVALQKRFDLGERDPAEVVVERDILQRLDDHVSILLVEKSRPLFTLQLIDENVDGLLPRKIFGIPGR
jgi:hypothetical protein